ncbi:hypothetical protein ZHAS_00022279 [Anopheles sinensis]|uniref:Uncharacterized protein n=1 Tax=Anopheles sinensis TaxID=74873 RepID=A0A084WUX7_ANOSI|nr:hypothetical protein ZHAS_00022279 [Anopheles sinensis]
MRVESVYRRPPCLADARLNGALSARELFSGTFETQDPAPVKIELNRVKQHTTIVP